MPSLGKNCPCFPREALIIQLNEETDIALHVGSMGNSFLDSVPDFVLYICSCKYLANFIQFLNILRIGVDK